MIISSATLRGGLQAQIDLGAPTESSGSFPLSLPLHFASSHVSVILCAISNSLPPITKENAAWNPKSFTPPSLISLPLSNHRFLCRPLELRGAWEEGPREGSKAAVRRPGLRLAACISGRHHFVISAGDVGRIGYKVHNGVIHL